MSTRSRIGILNKNGSVTAVYCHNDGYLSHNGRILLNHYTTATKVKQLLALGALSVLGSEIGAKHDMDDRSTRPKNSCVAYTRDRGDTLEKNKFANENAFLNDREEYGYLFKDGKWFVSYEEQPALVELSLEIIADRITS